MLDSTATVTRPANNRAKITNNPRRLRGVDARTRDGRRYADIVDSLVAEFGSHDPVRLRELAGLRFALERAQGSVVNGGECSLEDLVRLTNTIERKERALRASKRQTRDPTPTLAQIIAEHAKESTA
jgi:hypothetical protein